MIYDLVVPQFTKMLGNLLAQQFGPALNWPFGSAISVIFMVLLMVGVVFYLRSENRDGEAGL